MDHRLTQLWDPFALRLNCGDLELRAITDADIPELVELALTGIHAPGEMPFAVPWTEAPPDRLPAAMAAHYWAMRANFGTESWMLDLIVRERGVAVGVQGLAARHYLVTRTAETGSWLGRSYQGRGIGTAMRQAVCALAFDDLDAVALTSGAFSDNPASYAVSRKLGYVDNGTTRMQRRPGEVAIHRNLVLTPERFVRAATPVAVEGADAFRRAIGLDGS